MPARTTVSPESGKHLGQPRHDFPVACKAEEDDREQADDLDDREQAGKQYGFENSPCGDRSDQTDHDRNDDGVRKIEELANVSSAPDADGGRRHDAGADDKASGEKGKCRGTEACAHIGGFTGADGMASGKLGKRGGGECHHNGRKQERRGCMNASTPRGCADENINPGTDRYAHPVKHEQRQREPPPEHRRTG